VGDSYLEENETCLKARDELPISWTDAIWPPSTYRSVRLPSFGIAVSNAFLSAFAFAFAAASAALFFSRSRRSKS
jgi:hypothetical protein